MSARWSGNIISAPNPHSGASSRLQLPTKCKWMSLKQTRAATWLLWLHLDARNQEIGNSNEIIWCFRVTWATWGPVGASASEIRALFRRPSSMRRLTRARADQQSVELPLSWRNHIISARTIVSRYKDEQNCAIYHSFAGLAPQRVVEVVRERNEFSQAIGRQLKLKLFGKRTGRLGSRSWLSKSKFKWVSDDSYWSSRRPQPTWAACKAKTDLCSLELPFASSIIFARLEIFELVFQATSRNCN